MSNNTKYDFIGGKDVISRILNAYGFANRKLLAEYLGMPHSTFGTWASRNYFPAELVIHCVAETGARLEYVAYGIEPIFDDSSDLKYFHAIHLENGKFFIQKEIPFFISQLPNLDSRKDYDNLFAITENKCTYFANKEYGTLIDGEYFISVENSYLIRHLTILPASKVRVDGGKFSFECDVNDIEIVGKIILKIEKY
ncbi:TPA: phage repressor protein CI [Pasteurella multocida]|nr:phage repressor protein CI [Pasteurella multocida]HED4406688.1 phage repressor protein CI [Pasteurella multocida]